MIGNFILLRDSKVMRFGPGVGTQFSHGSGTLTECDLYSNIHPCSGFKVTVCVYSNKGTYGKKTLKFSVNRCTF